MLGPMEDAQAALDALAAYRQQTCPIPGELRKRLTSPYVTTAKYGEFTDALEQEIHNLATDRADGSRPEARGIVVSGGSGSGKSRAIDRALGKHAMFPGYLEKGSGCRAIKARCTGSFTLGRLGADLAEAAGYPIVKERDENKIWDKLRKTLRMRGIVLVYIDEVNSLLSNANTPQRKLIVASVKGLLNDADWPVIVVLSGTPRIVSIFGASDEDKEAARRMEWIEFPPLTLPRDVKKIATHVEKLCGIAGLAVDVDALKGKIVPRLIHAARYQLGSSVEIAIKAIEGALRSSHRTLEMEHFATAFARTPNVKRSGNPFVAADWRSVKVYDPDAATVEPCDDAARASAGRR